MEYALDKYISLSHIHTKASSTRIPKLTRVPTHTRTTQTILKCNAIAHKLWH